MLVFVAFCGFGIETGVTPYSKAVEATSLSLTMQKAPSFYQLPAPAAELGSNFPLGPICNVGILDADTDSSHLDLTIWDSAPPPSHACTHTKPSLKMASPRVKSTLYSQPMPFY